MNRRDFLVGAAGAGPVAAQLRSAGGVRPNIVVVLADDLPAWVLGCYGNKDFRTPNIDALARTGMRFNNSFVVTPICSASRATLFTGRVPRQHGIHDFLTDNPIESPPQGQKAPPASFAREVMISDLLTQAGYDCGYVGKWHMGADQQPGHQFSYTYTMVGGQRSYTDPEMYLNGKPVQEKGYLAELMTQRACEFLDRQTATKPFFLTVGYLNPHTPYTGHPQRYYDMYANSRFDTVGWEPPAANALREKDLLKDTLGNLRRAAAATTALDDQIPVLLKKLREKGFTDNTLILFTGDNGYLLGRHGLWSKGLASDPINMYEEVMRVPMILSWAGKIPAEASATELVSFTDVLPTLCDAAGVTTPGDRGLLGRSFLGIARRDVPDRRAPRWRNLVFGHFRNTEMARDVRYKLVLRNGGSGPNELYDLVADPREKANQYENPQYITVRDRLGKELAGWRQKTSG
ncbi:MAG TPA: sulfatase-like hydrolase/transferase [Bryobacteraceae bacterium]|nr:sulfatase-like hydrolase/transferase [Bryobacteraceae bacterium]